MIDFIVDFFTHPIFVLIAGISTLVSGAFLIYAIWLVARGIIPILLRLGKSLSKRNIAILASGDDYDNLRNVLISSGLFKKKNIKKIDKNSITTVQNESLLLMHWKSHKKNIGDILKNKKDAAVLIVYAPTEEGRIEPLDMNEINQQQNVTVVNFRGRLLNDVLVSMMTSRR